MGNLFYLLNLSVSGIKCIEKEVRLDFYKKTVDKDFDPEKYRVKAIYGGPKWFREIGDCGCRQDISGFDNV